MGSAGAGGLGTIYFGSGIAIGNNFNTISNCNISSSAGGTAITPFFHQDRLLVTATIPSRCVILQIISMQDLPLRG